MGKKEVSSKEFLKSFLENSDDKIGCAFIKYSLNNSSAKIIADGKGDILFSNDKFKELLGYEDEMLNIKDFEVLESESEISERILTIVNTNGVNFSTKHKKKSGEIFYSLVSCTLLNKNPVLILTSITDISSLKNKINEFSKLETAIGSAGETIIITDVKGNIVYCNPYTVELTGYHREEIIGQNPRFFKSGEHDDGFYKDLWQTITSGRIWRGKFVNKRKDGSFYREQATISPVFDEFGTIINYVAVKKDISREIELEAKLLQSQKLQSFSIFAGGIAHNFNNVLTTTNLNLEMGKNIVESISVDNLEKAKVKIIEYLDECSVSIKNASKLTKNLLTSAKKQVIKPEYLDLTSLLKDFLSLNKQIVPENISITLDTIDKKIFILSDRSELEQMLLNFLINSIEAIEDEGKINISCDLIDLVEHNYYRERFNIKSDCKFARILIKDSGCGMNSNTLEHLFDPFFTTKSPDKGTGLGLYTVFGIVKSNKGFIDIQSEKGKGALFTILFPFVEYVKNAPKSSHTLKKSIYNYKGNENVLIIEDDPNIRKIIKNILLKLGYNVMVAENGVDGLDIYYQNNSIDLIILDVVMPKLGGRKVRDKIRESDEKTKILFMSGYSQGKFSGNFEFGSNCSFIEKPFKLVELLMRIRTLLDN